MIGSWGKSLVFEVSADKVRTFNNLKRKSAMKIVKHSTANGVDKTQIIGSELDEVTFTMQFNTAMGIKPMGMVDLMRVLMRNKAVQKLRIGQRTFGDFMITSLGEDHKYYDNRGNLLSVDIDVTMLEYK